MTAMSFKQLIRNGDIVTDAFPARQALMPMWGQAAVDESEWPELWRQIVSTPLDQNMMAYVHIPFCINHCVFFGFYRNAWKDDQGGPYVDRLIAELAQEAAQRPAGGSVSAVYLGGGTPTALSAADLFRLLTALRCYLPLTNDCEITVEGRISHFDHEKINACIDAGANRFSIGVQTFNSAIRRRLGRKHSGDQAARYLAELAERGDAVVVADLIFGLPGQSDDVWQRDLDIALSLGLDGLDVYAFNCYPMLPINRMIEKGAFPALPGLTAQAAQYAYAVRRMQAAGWQQLSNSHFGSSLGRERNRYNADIKSGVGCLAFGSGGGGCHAGYAYSGHSDLPAYLNTPATEKPLGRLARAADQRDWLGKVQGGVERGIVDLSLLSSNSGNEQLMEDWQRKGLLQINAGQAKLTIAGRFWGPTIARTLAQSANLTSI